MQPPAFYVTGTDTGIGKTMGSTALLHALRARGHTAVGMKPVASGCERTPQGWRNEDALALQAASNPQPAYATLNPYALPAPLAPELAAADVGVTLSLEPITQAFAQLRAQAEVVVVEGVGGWAAPLSATLDQADLVRALQLPVVLVVGVRLGCINMRALPLPPLPPMGCNASAGSPMKSTRRWSVSKRTSACCASVWQCRAGDGSRGGRTPRLLLRLRDCSCRAKCR